MNSARLTITPSGGIDASTFAAGSFSVVNGGTSAIERLILGIEPALFSGLVFDPAGLAGDTIAKGFTLDSETGDGVGVTHSFVDGSDALGWRTLVLDFADFDPGETFTFSLDIDPASTRGSPAPGPFESASVSGLELVGSRVEVGFADGSSIETTLAGLAGSDSGSEAVLGPDLLPVPALSLPGLGQTPQAVSEATQQVLITGPAGAAYRLLVIEGGRFTSDAVDPSAPVLGSFAANSALAVQTIEGTLGPDGTAVIDVTLTRSELALATGETGTAGVNLITASLLDETGGSGPTAAPLVLELVEAAESTVVVALNAGGGAFTAVDGTVYAADSFFTGGNSFATAAPIAGTGDDPLYQSERWAAGGLGYDIPVANGDYLVTLHFAEIYFTSPGQRQFTIALEGIERFADLDLVAEVGPNAAFDLTLPVSVTDGSLDIDLIAGIENPKLGGIKVTTAEPGSSLPPTDLDVAPALFAEETAYSGTLTAIDPDSTILTFSLVDDPSGLFAVEGNQLVLTEPVDFEALPAGFTDQGDGTATIPLVLQVTDESGNTHQETVTLTVTDVDEAAPAISFEVLKLSGETATIPTSLQFGPDGRLYVADLFGEIHAFTVVETPAGYAVVQGETIDLVQAIPNHDDDGTPNPAVVGRQVTGLVVAGTAETPVLYVSSSDPRWGGGATGGDTGLDTNSGIISRLTKTGDGWEKVDIVRGLPRSEENHSTNGLHFDAATNTLLVAQGGNTNAGAPSQKFAYLNEYALSAAILSVDLDAIAAIEAEGLKGAEAAHPFVYDLPTVDDPTRDDDHLTPFGGNDGLNMARLVEGGPVQVFAPGFRNVYDLVVTQSGKIYTVDNGPNPTWGGYPTKSGTDGTVTNEYDPAEPGSATVNNLDGLHFIGTIDTPGYYGGHPVPLRANPTGAGLYTNDDAGTAVWRQQGGQGPFDLPADWLPVDPALANPIEGEFRIAGAANGSLYTWSTLSVNGITEYTASSFAGQLQNQLLAAALTNDTVYRIQFNETGDAVVAVQPLASNFAIQPIDVVAPGDDDPFAGTVWIASLDGSITVLRPAGGGGTPDDSDGDGYTDSDEIANGTDPFNAADRPPDFDGDFVSDLADPDDDGDGIPDVGDPFARDAANGTDTVITASDDLFYPLFGTNPGTGLFGLGFTGLMSNGFTDYLDQYDPEKLIPGGATGTFTIAETTAGDAIFGNNNQHNAFQFGVVLDPSLDAVVVNARLLNPFKGQTPQNYQSAGLYIGTGDQDHYVKIVVAANNGTGGIEVLYEEGGQVLNSVIYGAPGILTADTVDLFLTINLAAGIVTPSWSLAEGSGAPVVVDTGGDVTVSGQVLAAIQGDYTVAGQASGMAVGVISTHFGTAEPISASYDHIAVYAEPDAGPALASSTAPTSQSIILGTTSQGQTEAGWSSGTGTSLVLADLVDMGETAPLPAGESPGDGATTPFIAPTAALESLLVEPVPAAEA